jgi:Metallo-beta-lactamase superfamily
MAPAAGWLACVHNPHNRYSPAFARFARVAGACRKIFAHRMIRRQRSGYPGVPEHDVLFTGDTIAYVDTVVLGVFNQDRVRTVKSFRRLAALDVETACFGHGDPIISGAGARIRDAAATLTP